MDFAERERLMRYYEQKFAKELDETCPRVNFVTADLFKSAWNMGPPHPAGHLSQGAQQLMSQLGPFEPLTAEGLGKMRRRLRLFTHPDKKRPESCFYDEFSSYFDALAAYHDQNPQQKQVSCPPPAVFVPDNVLPLSAHFPPLSPVFVPDNVLPLSAHFPPLSPVSSQRTESVVMNDVGDLGYLALSPPPLEDSTSSDNDMHVPSPQPLSPPSPQRKTKRKSSGGAISSRPRRHKNKRKSNDDISFHPQHYPLQTIQYEFYIHQLLSKDLTKENNLTRTAIIAAIAWMKKGNNETISIADIRNTMSEYPDILILKDRSNVSDERDKTTQKFRDLRNRNQALKTNMKKKKNNNKMQLTDDITLMLILIPTPRTTTDGESYNSIFYSVEIKNS